MLWPHWQLKGKESRENWESSFMSCGLTLEIWVFWLFWQKNFHDLLYQSTKLVSWGTTEHHDPVTWEATLQSQSCSTQPSDQTLRSNVKAIWQGGQTLSVCNGFSFQAKWFLLVIILKFLVAQLPRLFSWSIINTYLPVNVQLIPNYATSYLHKHHLPCFCPLTQLTEILLKFLSVAVVLNSLNYLCPSLVQY